MQRTLIIIINLCFCLCGIFTSLQAQPLSKQKLKRRVAAAVSSRCSIESLNQAIYAGNLKQVQMIIQQGKVDVNSTDQYGWLPLGLAASLGERRIVIYLLDNTPVNVNGWDKNGKTALQYAASYSVRTNKGGNIFQALIEAGAKPIDNDLNVKFMLAQLHKHQAEEFLELKIRMKRTYTFFS